MQDITQLANNSGQMAGKWWIFIKGLKGFVRFQSEMVGVEITEKYLNSFYKVDLTTSFPASTVDVHSWFTGHRSNSMVICI